jgi:hypothetical protein
VLLYSQVMDHCAAMKNGGDEMVEVAGIKYGTA